MKRMASILAVVFILGLTAVPMTARSADNEMFYIQDYAELLTAAQRDELDKRAAEITEKYECEARIITLESIGELIPMHASNARYVEGKFGYGSDRSCALLLLSMEGRDFDLAVWGFAKRAFTEHGKDVILNKHILPLLKADNFHGAFAAFLDKTEEYLALASAGTPFDTDTDPMSKEYLTNLIARLGIVILLPLLIAAHICFRWVKKMRTSGLAQTALHYVPVDGFNLTGQQDTFLYRSVSRVKIERSSGSSGSRSVSSSSGGSHRSGKF